MVNAIRVCIFLLLVGTAVSLGNESFAQSTGESFGLKDNQKNASMFLMICIFLLITMLLFFVLPDQTAGAVFGLVSVILMLILSLVLFSPYEYGFVDYSYQLSVANQTAYLQTSLTQTSANQTTINQIPINQTLSNYEQHYSFTPILEYPDVIRLALGWIILVTMIGIAFWSIFKFTQ